MEEACTCMTSLVMSYCARVCVLKHASTFVLLHDRVCLRQFACGCTNADDMAAVVSVHNADLHFHCRFVLWEAEEQGLLLPYACRMGCCTACAVRVKEGTMSQPEALGISKELKDQGFALMCVGYPKTDLVLETVEEDEIYDLQFGDIFQQQAVDPKNKNFVERDDYALEVANMDE